ncbi:MAG: hypothetical protein KAR13_09910 [Desulfobulbaceae bacterium]|nr:hypothetical protein [Desulfobulbaceae bacterium]
MKITLKLDLELGWKRFKKDLKDMCFADHPYESLLIEANLKDYLANLAGKLPNYTPSRSEIIYIPKPNYHIRPGANLTPEDAIIFQSLLLLDIEKIRKSMLWSSSTKRFSYIVKEDQSGVQWFVNEYSGWKNFRIKSLEHIDQGYNYVLFADISGYFENISIQRLISDLRGIDVENEILNGLSSCLNRWAEPRSRGIPQGYRPSFVLSEVYLNSIDQRLKNKGIKFCRYVDDFRVFCKTKTDAIECLHSLTKLLREKELNLQTAKSYILEGKEARDKIDGIAPIVNEIEENLKEELKDIIDQVITYPSPRQIRAIIKKEEKNIKLETVRKAFILFSKESLDKFDKSLFHYCLNRLGASNDNIAVEYCIGLSMKKPEELPIILNYFSNLKDDVLEIAATLIEKFTSHFYPRHIYLLVRWLYIENLNSEKILSFCRTISNRCDLDSYSHHYAWAVLGNHGDAADLDEIESQYNQQKKEISKASILCGIRRMVADRRKSIFARAKGESQLIDYAINWSKVPNNKETI